MSCNADRRFQNGMTLIEVMFALSIFTVGILSVAAMQIAGIKCHQNARTATRDAFEVSGKLELLSVMPFQHDWLADRDGEYRRIKPDHGPFKRFGEPATIAWEIGAELPVAEAKRIAVTAHRIHPGHTDRELTYEWIKAGSYETRLLLKYKNQSGR